MATMRVVIENYIEVTDSYNDSLPTPTRHLANPKEFIFIHYYIVAQFLCTCTVLHIGKAVAHKISIGGVQGSVQSLTKCGRNNRVSHLSTLCLAGSA